MSTVFDDLNGLSKEQILDYISKNEKIYQEAKAKSYNAKREADFAYDKFNDLCLYYYDNYTDYLGSYIKIENNVSNTILYMYVTNENRFGHGNRLYNLVLTGAGYWINKYTFDVSTHLEYYIEEDSIHVFNDRIKSITKITKHQYLEAVINFVNQNVINKINDFIDNSINQ